MGHHFTSPQLSKKEVQERAILIRNDLLSANYQNRYLQTGIRQVLNRLLVCLQEPYVIVILSKSEKKDKYQILYHTFFDPLWKDHFENFLIDEEKGIGKLEEDWIYVDRKKYKKSIFKIFDKEYIMLFKVDFSLNIPRFIIRIRKQLEHDKKFDEVSALKSLLTEKTKQLYLSENLSGQFRSKENCWKNGKIIINDKCSNYQHNKLNDEIIKKQFEEISRIFNEEYKRILDSPLLSPSGKNPPNIIFFLKNYIQDQPRYHGKNGKLKGCYTYNVRVVIPDMQKDNIRHTLQALSECEIKTKGDDKYFKFPIYTVSKDGEKCIYEKTGKEEENKIFPGDDSFFWEEIKTPEGREKIIGVMESSFGIKARSLSDPTLSSGYVYINHNPFSNGGTNRLEDSEKDKGKDSDNYRRLVSYHYIMSLMASADGDISGITVPGSVNGSTWFCMTFLSKNNQDEQERWLDNYHFYHSICHYTIRGIRRRLKNRYLEAIGEIYFNYIGSVVTKYIEKSNNELKNKAIGDNYIDFQKDVCDYINNDLLIMARIYPFNALEFTVMPRNSNKFPEKENDFYHEILSRFKCLVVIKDNPFFIRDESNFLKKKEIRNTLAIIDRQLVRELQFQRKNSI